MLKNKLERKECKRTTSFNKTHLKYKVAQYPKTKLKKEKVD